MTTVVIAAVHYPVASGRYMRDAFIRQGATVYTVGGMVTYLYGQFTDETTWWRPNPPPSGLEPDLMLLMDSDLETQKSALKLPARRRAVYGVDNHVRRYVGGFDHYFLAHYHGTAQPIEESESASWLPCGYDPTVFRPSPIPWDEREYDFCLVGVMYPERQRRVNLLRNAGYKVFAATGLLYSDYEAAYHNSRISLCVSAAGDVAMRVFETAACGCLILTDPLHDLMDEYTNQRLGLSGFAIYHDDRELLIQAEALLGEEKHVAQGGVASMLFHIQRHTWDERARTILKWLNAKYS